MRKVVKKIVLLFFILTGTAFGYSRSSYSMLKDITCPEQPPIPAGQCKPVCPAGYKLSADTQTAYFEKTGFYICVKEGTAGATGTTTYSLFGSSSSTPSGTMKIPLLNACTYYNPYCSGAAQNEREAVEKYVQDSIKDYLNAPSNDTYIKKLLMFATFDPDYAKEVATKDVSSNYLFFYDSFQEISKIAPDIAILYFAFLSIWLTAFFASTKLMGMAGEDFKISLIRALFGFAFFLVPIPQSTPSGIIYQPAVVKAVRFSVYLGNDFAEKTAKKLNAIYIAQMISGLRTNLSTLEDMLKEKLDGERKQIQFLEKQLTYCQKLYDNADFLVPDDVLREIPYTGDAAILSQARADGVNPDMLSKVACREIERNYKDLLTSYNRKVAFLNSVLGTALTVNIPPSTVKNIIEHPSTFTVTKTDNPKGQIMQQIRYIALWQKKLGWISYPLITLPVVQFNEEVMTSITDMSVRPEPNRIAKAIGILSFPPGSMILSTVNDLSSTIVKLASSFLAVAGWGPAGKIAAFFLRKGMAAIGSVLSLVISYIVTMSILRLLPIMVLMMAFVFRLIIYVVDVVKMMIISPFISIHAVTVRRYDNLYRFLGRIFALAVEPLILILASFVAFFTVKLTRFMLYTIPVDSLNALKDMGVGLNWFTLFVMEGVFFYVSIIASSFLAYKIVMSSVETFFEMFGLDKRGGIAQTGREIVESMSRKVGTPL